MLKMALKPQSWQTLLSATRAQMNMHAYHILAKTAFSSPHPTPPLPLSLLK
jgi:hypothetical protein